MSDARQSPIPQDRVNENVDQGQRAHDSTIEKRIRDRATRGPEADDRPGPQPGIPRQAGPAEGGD
jgi:hypothetical protein